MTYIQKTVGINFFTEKPIYLLVKCRILILIVEDRKIIFLRTLYHPFFILQIQHEEDDISVTINKYKS